MRRVKLSLLALVLVSSVVGCGGSNNKANVKELTPEQIAEQEATLKQVEASEREHQKNTPKPKRGLTEEEKVEQAEQSRRR
ncbi:hypothetical protein J0H58_01095 [bacterium]|nr:hypothetical protein [bacterium]